MRTEPPDNRKAVLELCFITLIGLIVIGAFIAALNYDSISARAPLFVMVPLLILIGVQFNYARKQASMRDMVTVISSALKGNNYNFNRVSIFIGLMALLLLLIDLVGHYIGISVFMFVLMRWIAKEKLWLSIAIAAGVTLLIFVLFEHGFNIELYRGYLFKLLSRATL